MKIKSKFFLFFLLSINSQVFAKPSTMPEWVQNYKKVYPDTEYLCQRGSGKKAEEARADALATLARYFEMNVNANLSTTMSSVSTSDSIQEETKVINSVEINSQVEFFGLEFTEPYYFKKEKKWYCVAYINRENAWIQYRPQIEIEKNTFEGFYKKLEKEADYFTKLKILKQAWQQGKELIEKLEFGRIISPSNEREYSIYREKFSEIPVIFEDEKLNCKVHLNIQGDYNRIFSTSISGILSECGFNIVKNKDESTYIADIIIEDNIEGVEPLSITPTINIKILSKNNKTVYSLENSLGEKTISYTLENAQKKAYPKLVEQIKVALEKEFDTAFKL